MIRVSRLGFVAVLLIAVGCQKPDVNDDLSVGWALKPPEADAKPFKADGKMVGVYPVGSRIEDKEALGGFGRCSNFPKDLGDRTWGTEGSVAVVVFPQEAVAYNTHRGFAVRVVNRTSEDVPFAARDSILSLVCEAQNPDGTWQAIESRMPSICGNSFHQVFLGKNQFWEFPARQYNGSKKVKLRFRLEPVAGRPEVLSNEFEGNVTAAQLAGG